MHYIPNAEEVDIILEEMGLDSIDELFSDIPESVRINGLNLPEGLSELEVLALARDIARQNMSAMEYPTFLGFGLYNHFVPPAVRAILGRSEFYTSYTPYQPEVSQGMLQTLFEYQSLIASLTEMDLANASMYDGSTALAEAALMAMRVRKKNRILIPEMIHPSRESVLRNYALGPGMKIEKYPFDRHSGTHDLDALVKMVDDSTAAVVVEVPNSLGYIEDGVMELKEAIGDVMLIVYVNPISLGLLEPPGRYGADIVVGEGQPLGLPVEFGGPLIGIFATRMKYIRQMPGRIIGMTEDSNGRRAYVMTFQTREQHIRRARATSNICSNEALCAVANAVYLSLMGPQGLRRVAEISMARAHYMARKLSEIAELPYGGEFFNEFVWHIPSAREVLKKLQRRGIFAGIDLQGYYGDGMKDMVITAVTEMNSIDDINSTVDAIKEVVG